MERQNVNSESGNIRSAGYDPQGRTMHVEFKGGRVYEYADVTPDEWTGFEATFSDAGTSTGSHFNQVFRGKHAFRQMD